MELRVIPPRKRNPNKYDPVETYEIPVKVLKVHRSEQIGKVIPITIERLDFETGHLVNSDAITFQASLELFDSLNLELPFYTDCIISQKNKEIEFKVVGIYNTGLIENAFSVAEILNNNEDELNQIFKSNYAELNKWLIN